MKTKAFWTATQKVR